LSSPHESLLQVENLEVLIPRPSANGKSIENLRAIDGVSLSLRAGRTLGLVGESGSGKSLTALSIMGLLPPPAHITSGRVVLEGRDITALGDRQRAKLRGDRVGMVFQEPMTALNPVKSIGDQVSETLILHRGVRRKEAWDHAENMLARVGIPGTKARMRHYPHQLSGGMRQRVLIAMALICHPPLLIADEPTTALDVTVQAQILDLLMEMQEEMGMAIMFISHNLAVISEIADEVAVLYAGRVVEKGPAKALFKDPRHPYTQALLATIPKLAGRERAREARLLSIPGRVPVITQEERRCRFMERCPLAGPVCTFIDPELQEVGPNHKVACAKIDP